MSAHVALLWLFPVHDDTHPPPAPVPYILIPYITASLEADDGIVVIQQRLYVSIRNSGSIVLSSHTPCKPNTLCVSSEQIADSKFTYLLC